MAGNSSDSVAVLTVSELVKQSLRSSARLQRAGLVRQGRYEAVFLWFADTLESGASAYVQLAGRFGYRRGTASIGLVIFAIGRTCYLGLLGL